MFTHSIRRRLVIGSAALTAAALALAGCGRSEDSADAAPQATTTVSEGPATGNLTVWAMGTEGENLPKLHGAVPAGEPGREGERHPDPVGRGAQQVHHRDHRADAAGRRDGRHHLDGRVRRPRRARPDAAGLRQRRLLPGRAGHHQGGRHQYGVPWYVETRLVYYRKDLAAKAGITTPPTDWDGLKAMAKAMKEKAGAKYGINLQPGGTGSWQTVMPFAWSAGASLTSDDQKEFTFDTPEMQEGLKYYQSFFTEKLAGTDLPPNQTEAQFVSGQVPMFISGPWMAGLDRQARR